MREILYRGKRLDNGEWVEGYYLFKEDITLPGLSKYFIVQNKNGDTLWFEVDPETVGQFTGKTAQCTDKIFEGDRCIVTTFDCEGADYQHECVVVWDNGCLAFSNEENEFWLPVAYVEDTDSEVEIIGNRWDNPELLEGTL